MLISKIDAQYNSNKLFLEQAKSKDAKDTTNFKSSYVKCGAPFFKDALGNPAPFNDDYKYRKNITKEFFPYDIPTSSPRWKTSEKVALINGVKDQMISHIKSQQSQKLCSNARKTRGKVQKLKFISHNQDMEQSSMMDIYVSIQKSYPTFTINWSLISFKDLHSSHSVSECMGMWFSYLRPDINRDPFTEEENKVITNAVVGKASPNWTDIANHLDRRSSLQTFVHFHTTFSRVCPSKVRWNEYDDAKLMAAIEKFSCHNIINWGKVGNALPLRNKTQCYNRYILLSKAQGKKKGVFSPEENRKLMNFVEQMGENFNKLPKDLLPGRTLVQIRNHYNVALKHKGSVFPWTREEDKILMEFVEKNGTNSWSKVAEILETHNRLSCRTRFLTISKFLTKNPDKSLSDVPVKFKAVTAVQKANSEATDKPERIPRSKGFGSDTFTMFKKSNPSMYQLLRTTYNYDLAKQEVRADSLKVVVLQLLLQVSSSNFTKRVHMFTPNQLQKLTECMSFKIEQFYIKEMRFITKHAQFLMPPSYNTVVGFRAISIKLHEDPLTEEAEAPENKSQAYRDELVKFQKLYFSLFYWTAMLTKLDKDELNHIQFLKYPKVDMTATDIFRTINKRNIQVTKNFLLDRSPTKSKEPPTKRQKLSD